MARRRRRGRSNSVYRYTPRRAAALKRAQTISARKRRNKRIKTAAIVAGTVTGVGASAYLGYKHGGNMGNVAKQVVSRRPKKAGASNGPFSAANLNAKRAVQPQIKETKRTVIEQVAHDGNGVSKAFGKSRYQPAREKRPYSVDRFINRDILYGRKLKRGRIDKTNPEKSKPKYIDRQIAIHQKNKGELTKKPVDGSKILKDMIADGSVRGRVSGKRRRTKTNRQVGTGNKKQTLADKAFQQWLKDNPGG